jgi:hypothetical protein
VPYYVFAAMRSLGRVTGGNFRLLNHVLTQMQQILEINRLERVTKEVDAAHESLVIALGIPSSPRAAALLTVFFTWFTLAALSLSALTTRDRSERCSLFSKWGGMDKAKNCFPDLH